MKHKNTSTASTTFPLHFKKMGRESEHLLCKDISVSLYCFLFGKYHVEKENQHLLLIVVLRLFSSPVTGMLLCIFLIETF